MAKSVVSILELMERCAGRLIKNKPWLYACCGKAAQVRLIWVTRDYPHRLFYPAFSFFRMPNEFDS